MATAIKPCVELARQWPLCQSDMVAIVRHLASLDASEDEIEAALQRDFPSVPDTVRRNIARSESSRVGRQHDVPDDPRTVDVVLEQLRRAAHVLVGELIARDCGIIRISDARVKVEYWGDGIPEKLTAEMRARIEACADELWDLASSQRPAH